MCCFSPVARTRSPRPRLARLLGRLRRLAGGAAWSGAEDGGVKVAGTRIFARREAPLAQLLVYSMELSVDGDVAMILPLPVARGGGDAEGDLSFVDLTQRPRFFEHLEKLFLLPLPQKSISRSQPQLVVHTVGAYEASFVPTTADFSRLDPRFRLPESTWSALGDYRDFGFAVFKLARATRSRVHPMALRFRTRFADRLFFPTVHVHDGRVHPTARFDHALYWQQEEDRPDGDDRRSDVGPLDSADGLLVPERPVMRRMLIGELPNRDTWVEGA